MANTLVHVTGFPHNSVVSERYLLISDGKILASAILIYNEIADEDDIEIKFGDEEPFKIDSYDDVSSFEEALSLMRERFGDIAEETKLTYAQAKVARLID